MKTYVMSRNLLATAASVVILGFMTTNFVAAQEGGKPSLRLVTHHGAQHRWHMAHRAFASTPGGVPAYNAVSPPFAGRGYYYMPGQGIVGESCEMPTSACWHANEW